MAMPPGFESRMQVDEAASDQSSSSLSPPPTTPQHNDTIRVARPAFLNPHVSGEGVANGHAANSAQSHNAAAHAQNSISSTHALANGNGVAPEKPKRQRKKREIGPDGKPVPAAAATNDGKPREKKPRKPREPKDKPAGATVTAPRKRQKTEEKVTHDAPVPSRQPTITEMVNGFQQPLPPASATPSIHPQPQHRLSLGLPASVPSTSRPVSSGQNYDPVRGYDPVRAATMETAQSNRPINPMNGTSSAQASPRVNRASASPSIASLIDPPMATTKTSMPAPPHYSPQTTVQPQPFVAPPPRSPTPPKQIPASFPHPPRPRSPPPSATANSTLVSTMDGAMDVDLTCEAPKPTVEIKAPSKSSSSGPTPKATRPTPPPVKGTGSGLLSSNPLFGGPSSGEATERKGVDIDIQIPLNPQGGNTINIAQEIAKKYGHDAINPRAAAHREQLLRIAAAANKIEGGSADDMSLDLMSEAGDDSNVEMGGMDEDKSGADGTDGKAPIRRRRKKVEEYDKEDDFIDDAELAWQEGAAVAKDGFFVYSGPLVPEGQAANVESSAPSARGGRGRGRGGGRGSRGGGGASGTTHTTLAEKARDPNAPTRARARGRGTGAPRKPRITKADRERMEAEKSERERAAGHPPSQQPTPRIGGPTGAPLAMAPTLQQQHQLHQQPPHGYGGPQGTLS